ncbi:MAG: hypothetical protein IT437_13320 [Phycisphaerales bacterium]|nr:hypothetical protein [Phycisphaerales bacterium]
MLMRRQIASLATLLASAAGAAAQCSWSVSDVPDFDQKRRTSASTPGLPNDGKMYCVPTSAVNWFAYFANHGIEQPLTLDGPRDWESNAEYDRVTGVIDLMGDFMQTSPSEGTKGQGTAGAAFYAALFTQGDVTVIGHSMFGDDHAPTRGDMLTAYALGGYILGGYGRYTNSLGGVRGGGHAFSITGMIDNGCGFAPIMKFRDPADDSPNFDQHSFRTSMAALTPVFGAFTAADGSATYFGEVLRMDVTAPSNQFLDSLKIFYPTSGFFAGNTEVPTLKIVRPVRPTGSPAPATINFAPPGGLGAILDAAVGPTQLSNYYLAARTGAQAAGVWRLNPETGASTRVTSGHVFPTNICISRFNDLYVLDGDTISRYDLSTTPATFLNDWTPSTRPEGIVYDDRNDTIVVITEKPSILPRRILAFPRTMSGFGTSRVLGVALNGTASITPDVTEDGAFWVWSEQSPTLSRVVYSTTSTEYEQTDGILSIQGNPETVNVLDNGRLVYAINGVLLEREKNAQGNWVLPANPRWNGRTTTGKVAIARSRHNWLSAMDHPDFDNLEDPMIYPFQPDCYADCNEDGVLNLSDFGCFQTKFALKDFYADCNQDGVRNLSDFGCFQTKFALGCP